MTHFEIKTAALDPIANVCGFDDKVENGFSSQTFCGLSCASFRRKPLCLEISFYDAISLARLKIKCLVASLQK